MKEREREIESGNLKFEINDPKTKKKKNKYEKISVSCVSQKSRWIH